MMIETSTDFPVLAGGVDFGASAERLRHSVLKRMLDLVGAGLGLVVMAPFLLLVALLIVIDSRGPVIFRQRRTGYDGKVFYIYKFRTMRVLEDGPHVVQACKDDERTTRLGRFLRRSSIDELPQLLNVLKGEMSLVGPRPHALAHDQQFAVLLRDYSLRYIAKPGITGLAQVAGYRGEFMPGRDMADRLARDIHYIANWSLILDIKILVQTVFLVPLHRSAY